MHRRNRFLKGETELSGQNVRIHGIYRIAITIVTLILAALLMVQAVLIRQGGAFSREIVAERLWQTAPAMFVWTILALTGIFIPKSPARNKKQAKFSWKRESWKHRRKARIAVLIVAIALIAVGIFNGGMRDVFVKAINICTECIGLG